MERTILHGHLFPKDLIVRKQYIWLKWCFFLLIFVSLKLGYFKFFSEAENGAKMITSNIYKQGNKCPN